MPDRKRPIVSLIATRRPRSAPPPVPPSVTYGHRERFAAVPDHALGRVEVVNLSGRCGSGRELRDEREALILRDGAIDPSRLSSSPTGRVRVREKSPDDFSGACDLIATR